MQVAGSEVSQPLSQPITVFISHRWAEGEHAFAMELATRLVGYLQVIIDEDDLKAGVNIENWMRASVKLADVFLYLMTPLSLESPNCQLELTVARRNRKPIIPMLLRNAVLPSALKKLKYVDLRNAKTLPFSKIEEIVEVIKYHAVVKERIRHSKTITKKVKGIGSQPLTALSLADDVRIGAWIIPITELTAGMFYVSMTNLTTIPREIIVDARVKGDGVKFGPFADLSITKITKQRVYLPGGKPVEIGLPFSVAESYVDGSAQLEVRSGAISSIGGSRGVSISLPVHRGSYPVFQIFS